MNRLIWTIISLPRGRQYSRAGFAVNARPRAQAGGLNRTVGGRTDTCPYAAKRNAGIEKSPFRAPKSIDFRKWDLDLAIQVERQNRWRTPAAVY